MTRVPRAAVAAALTPVPHAGADVAPESIRRVADGTDDTEVISTRLPRMLRAGGR